jgi:F-type H+-transporting ATPase subunit b
MLSRLAVKHPRLPGCYIRLFVVRHSSTLPGSGEVERLIPAPTYPSVRAEQAPERDTKNFPRLPRPEEPGKCRLFIVPEEYFQFFYKKTGVTGPYVFGAGVLTYLMSKEIMVAEHEFYGGLIVAAIVYTAVKMMGPNLKETIKKEVEEADKPYADLKDKSVALLESAIKEEKHSQWQAQGQKLLFDAKRENIFVQLEAAFRERQMQVYKAVKSRLDYKMEMDNVTRRFQHQHMVDWIVGNVRKSITPDLEKKSLDQCIQDLKSLAARA